MPGRSSACLKRAPGRGKRLLVAASRRPALRWLIGKADIAGSISARNPASRQTVLRLKRSVASPALSAIDSSCLF